MKQPDCMASQCEWQRTNEPIASLRQREKQAAAALAAILGYYTQFRISI